jgi:hypothetical protein
MTKERGQKQFRLCLRAVYDGKDYIYNVLFLDPEHPEAGKQISLDMTEEEVRQLAAAGQWPGISDIDKPLREAREAATRRLGRT